MKIGDKVRIKSIEWYNNNKDKDGNIRINHGPLEPFYFMNRMIIYFGKDRAEYCGKEFTIMHNGKYQGEDIFVLKGDNHGFNWCEWMFDTNNNNKDMETRNIKIDLKTAKEWFDGSDETLKKLALQAYKEEELTDSLPNSWEEFCDTNKCLKGEVYIRADSRIVNHEILGGRAPKTDRNLLPSYKSAEAHLALMQLERLRDCYRNGWEPDWEDADTTKYSIFNFRNKLKKERAWEWSRLLSFQTIELRDKFFDNFKDLIEIAKDLI